MKVAIMTGVYGPDIGGSATYLKRLRTDLLASGHEVQVVTFGEAPSEPGIMRVSRRLPIPARLAVYGYWIARLMADADVWFVNDYGLVAMLLKPFFRKPAVMKVIGDWAWEYAQNRGFAALPIASDGAGDPLIHLQRSRQHPRVEFRKAIRAIGARAMDHVVVPSEYLAGIVAAWGVPRRRISIVPNGMMLEDHPGVREPAAIPTILTAARLVPWKGIDHLLRAFALVRVRLPGARLVVLGDGPERRNLEELAADLQLEGAVTFAGQVPRAEVLRRMRTAHVFALPSAYEGLPHVVLEALTIGCPVVAGAAGGTPEVIRDQVDGLLVPFGDAEALATALTRALVEPELAIALSEQGKRRVAEAFSWSATRDATVALLDEMARKGSASRAASMV